MNRRPLVVVVALVAVLSACAPATTGSDPASARSSAGTPTETPSPSAEAAAPSATAEGSAAPPPSSRPEDALLAITLTDVRSDERFTLGELAATAGPVLLEPMAVWCSNCRAQQHEVKRAHDSAEFASVSLDVDLSETPDDLAAYADREGFDWRFAMADASLYRMLQERFGVAATNPPSTPLIVIERDGSVRPLEFGRGTRSPDQLIAEIQEG
jgi:hypothetical protein